MAEDKEKGTVSAEELVISNMWEIEAILRVLIKKGITTEKEVLEEINNIKIEADKNKYQSKIDKLH